jgi:hypothetical protein
VGSQGWYGGGLASGKISRHKGLQAVVMGLVTSYPHVIHNLSTGCTQVIHTAHIDDNVCLLGPHGNGKLPALPTSYQLYRPSVHRCPPLSIANMSRCGQLSIVFTGSCGGCP